MRTLAAVLILLATLSASGDPVITSLDPTEGFNFGRTRVTIAGSGFTEGAVTVLFGEQLADVLDVKATRLIVEVVAPPLGARQSRTVAVTVRVANSGEAVYPSFHFFPNAEPNPENFMPVIVPLTARTIHGANGSIWTSELHVLNESPWLLRMPGPETLILAPPVDPAIALSEWETKPVELRARDNSVDGAFLYVPLPLVPSTKFSLRVRDTSKNAGNLGVEIPVFSGPDSAGELTLIDIPTDPQYRSTLRIYGWTSAPMTVGVTVYPENGNTAIEHYDVTLSGVVTLDAVPYPPYPAHASFDPLTAPVRASGQRVRIELTNYGQNVSPPLPNLAAFLSLTNNETQQVTIVQAQ